MYKCLQISCLFLFFLIGTTESTFAQEKENNPNEVFSPELFSGLKYRSVGPTRGGRSTAACGVPSQPYTFYMGATGGGVWKTTDAGTSWKNISDGQIKCGSIGAISVAPSDPNVVYVGTGSADPRGNVSPGIGIYKSTNAGMKWKHIGLPKVGQIGSIEIHPQNPDIIFVAALGQIFGPNPERGIYRSKNGGADWEKILFASDSTGASDIIIDPNNPRILYAAMWRAERKPWTLIDGGKEGGIWKSEDGGDNWKKLEGGLPTGLLGKIGLTISPANSQRVWAIIVTPKEETGGVYRTDNGGNSWTRICRDHNLRQRGWYYSHIHAHPTDENTVYVSNVGFFKSIDGGKTFEYRIRTPHGDHHGFWLNPNNPQIVISANDGGACISLNEGKSWSTQLNQPTSEFYRLTVDNQFPYRLYAGQQDNTTISVPSHTGRNITPFESWYAVGGSECGDVAVNPNNPDEIWAGSYSGELTIMNRKTGQVRQVTAYPHYTEGTEQRDLKYRWQWNFPIVVSKYNPGTVYHTSNFVHKSTDYGQNWEIISPDLTNKMEEYLKIIPGGPVQHDATGVEVYSSIFAFEESPHNEGELWAGSDDGLVYISRDGGENWENITPENMPKEGTVNKIELSSHAPGRAFLAVYNYRYNDFKPYIFKTEDYGKSWNLLTDGKNGIPEDHFVRAIGEDPDRPGLLYAGTEFGMYISFDDGTHWQSLQLNLPHSPITDLEIANRDLVLSTQGRSFWILDDLSPLHQLTDEIAKSENYLFKPRDTYRTNLWGYNAQFHFYLKEKPEKDQSVKVEIMNEGGEIIRVFSSKADKTEGEEKLKVKKGFNTLSWNLRHTGPNIVNDLVTMVIGNPPAGPRAIPGMYSAKITIGDWTSTQSFQILKDPRWTDVSNEDYQAQLDLSKELANMLTESHNRLKNLRAIKDQISQIAELGTRAGHSEKIKSAADSLNQKITKLEAKIKNKAEASQDNINYRRVFSNHLGRLYQVVVNAQHRPTGGALERYEDLKTEYVDIVSDYEDITDKALPAFNRGLVEEDVERVILPEQVE